MGAGEAHIYGGGGNNRFGATGGVVDDGTYGYLSCAREGDGHLWGQQSWRSLWGESGVFVVFFIHDKTNRTPIAVNEATVNMFSVFGDSM